MFMNRLFPFLNSQRVMVACLVGIFLSIEVPSYLHAQTGIPAPDISNEVWLNSTPQPK